MQLFLMNVAERRKVNIKKQYPSFDFSGSLLRNEAGADSLGVFLIC